MKKHGIKKRGMKMDGMKKGEMRKYVKGTFTIEASVIVPVILFMFSLIITMLFYFHDKNVMSVITHETLAMGCSKDEISEEELEHYFFSRLDGKLILFPTPTVEVDIDGEQLHMECTAIKQKMRLHVEMKMKQTDPEEYIWQLRRLDKLGENLKDTLEENVESNLENSVENGTENSIEKNTEE